MNRFFALEQHRRGKTQIPRFPEVTDLKWMNGLKEKDGRFYGGKEKVSGSEGKR